MKTPAPTRDEIEKWHRWFATETNNLAWMLAENQASTLAEREQMLNSAHTSAFHWSSVGSAIHTARADMLLGQVHAMLRNASLAIAYARRSYDYITSHESPDWEIALAHAVLANAAHAAQELSLHAKHYALAKHAGDAISDSGDKEIFDRIFNHLPTPQT